MTTPYSETAPLTAGLILQYARSKLVTIKGVRLTLVDFAKRCHEIEDKRLKQASESQFSRKGRLFAARSDHGGRIARGYELGKREITAAHAEIMEAALELPPQFLRATFKSVTEIEDAYAAYRRSKTARAGREEPAPAIGVTDTNPLIASRPNADTASFPSFYTNQNLTASRSAVIADIQQFHSSLRPGDRSIFVLKGSFGTGKTFVGAKWWHSFGSSQFVKSAIRIDCSNKTVNQITREALLYYIGHEAEAFDLAALARLKLIAPIFMWFDQLQYSADNDANASASPRDLIHALSPLFSERIPVNILISAQTVRISDNHLGLTGQIPQGVVYGSAEVRALDPSEGADLLHSAGCSEISRPKLENLSRQLGGIPICLDAAAQRILEFRTAAERESYCVHLASGSPSSNQALIAEFFSKYLKSVIQGRYPGGHPEAVLRLLALMPGPIHRQFLEDLLRELKINRLEDFDPSSATRLAGRFVTMNSDRIDLHPMARDEIRRDLDSIVAGSADANTNRNEIAQIHLASARINNRSLENVPEVLSLAEIEAIEGVVFHLLRYRDCRPPEAEGKSPAKPKHNDADRIFEGRANPFELTQFCYNEIAVKFLSDRGKQVTRLLGQYETKAKILSHFFRSRSISSTVPFLDDLSTLNLLIDVAVCFMHSGRLQLAARATAAAKHCLLRLYPENSTETPGQEFSLAEKGSQHRWALGVEVLAISTFIQIRMGVRLSTVLVGLQHYADQARKLFDQIHGNELSLNFHRSPAMKATIRIYSRLAHVHLLMGKIEDAINLFERATLLQEKRSTSESDQAKHLTGEAARHYCAALMHGATTNASRLALAEYLIEENVSRYEEFLVFRQYRTQNDVIPFYILRAKLERQRGHFAQARTLIEAVGDHEYIRSGECTFVAQMELEFERVETALALDITRRADFDRIQDLVRQLDAEHHLLMAAECSLLEAKMLRGSERTSKLRDVIQRFSDQGVRLWDDEIASLFASSGN